MTRELKITKKREIALEPDIIIRKDDDIEVLTAEQANAIQKEKKRQARERATGNSPAEKLAKWRMIYKATEKLIEEKKESNRLLKKKIKRMEKIMEEQDEL